MKDFLSMKRINSNDWSDNNLKFAMFHATLSQCFTRTAALLHGRYDTPAFRASHHAVAMSAANLQASLDLFKAMHELEPTRLRVLALYNFYRALDNVVRNESLAVARSAQWERFPAGDDASYAVPNMYWYGTGQHAQLTDRFNFRAVDNAAERAARVFNCYAAGCKGVFSSRNGKCTTCLTSFCVDCHSLTPAGGGDHACAPAEKESIDEIQTSTKQCPSCLMAVYKSSGCDQMMCTLCHAMFLFSTGELVKRSSALHNPYYLALPRSAQEAVRRNLANHVDVTPYFEIIPPTAKAAAAARALRLQRNYDLITNDAHHKAVLKDKDAVTKAFTDMFAGVMKAFARQHWFGGIEYIDLRNGDDNAQPFAGLAPPEGWVGFYGELH
jgi:predicted nucleic acid-binding protein